MRLSKCLIIEILLSVMTFLLYSADCNYDETSNSKLKLIKVPLKRVLPNIWHKNYALNEKLLNDTGVENNKASINKRESRQISRNIEETDKGTKEFSVNVTNVELTGTIGQGYYMEIFIGTPSQSLNVLIDTGSSNFAIAATANPQITRFFDPTVSSSFSANEHETVTVPYTQGEWVGYFGKEVVKIPPLVAIETSVGFITRSTDFFIAGANWEGILGLAYKELAKSSSNDQKTSVWEDIVRSLNIDDIFSFSLCDSFGSLTLGGTDENEYVGDIYYIPIKREWYYDVLVTDILIGQESLGLDCKEYNFDKVIIDTGTTYLHFPSSTFNQLINIITKNVQVYVPETFWHKTESLCYFHDEFPWESFPNITMSFYASSLSDWTYEIINLSISPHLYIRQSYASWFSDKKCYRFAVAKSREAGTVIGAIFMEGFHTVFDRKNKRIGFGISSCVKSGWSGITVSNGSGDPSQCAYDTLYEAYNLVFIIFILICVLSSSILFFTIAFFVIKVEFFQKESNDSPIQPFPNVPTGSAYQELKP